MKLIMLVAMCFIWSASLVFASTSQMNRINPFPEQSDSQQASQLINQLVFREEKRKPNEIFIIPPDIKTQEQVRSQLLELANQSADARSAVIQVLIKVVDDELTREEALSSTRWTASVEVLGELKALEAIDVLVKNLTASGLIINIVPHPRPAKDALLKIGKPAIPRLIQALSPEGAIRYEAIDTLADIEPVAIPQLIEALSNANPYIRGGAAVALGMIGGPEAKDAINQALIKETNSRAKADFKYALDYIHRYKEPSKSR